MINVQDIVNKAGGPTKLARLLGCSHVTVIRWKHITLDRLLEIEKVTGIPRDELCPDIFKERIEG